MYEVMEGWLHCFRNPDLMLPKGVPRILWSESDTMDPFLGEEDHNRPPGIFGMQAQHSPTLVPREPGTVTKKYDLVYR